jgi:glutaredoxin
MLVGISFIHPVKASTPVVVHYFYDESCTHCQDARVFLDALAISEPRFELSTYDVKIAENTPLFNEVRRVFGKRHAMTPMIVIGGVMLVGYNEQTQVDIVSLYNRYCEGDYVDVVQMIIDGEYVDPSLIESIRFSPGDYVILPLIVDFVVFDYHAGRYEKQTSNVDIGFDFSHHVCDRLFFHHVLMAEYRFIRDGNHMDSHLDCGFCFGFWIGLNLSILA